MHTYIYRYFNKYSYFPTAAPIAWKLAPCSSIRPMSASSSAIFFLFLVSGHGAAAASAAASANGPADSAAESTLPSVITATAFRLLSGHGTAAAAASAGPTR